MWVILCLRTYRKHTFCWFKSENNVIFLKNKDGKVKKSWFYSKWVSHLFILWKNFDRASVYIGVCGIDIESFCAICSTCVLAANIWHLGLASSLLVMTGHYLDFLRSWDLFDQHSCNFSTKWSHITKKFHTESSYLCRNTNKIDVFSRSGCRICVEYYTEQHFFIQIPELIKTIAIRKRWTKGRNKLREFASLARHFLTLHWFLPYFQLSYQI